MGELRGLDATNFPEFTDILEKIILNFQDVFMLNDKISIVLPTTLHIVELHGSLFVVSLF